MSESIDKDANPPRRTSEGEDNDEDPLIIDEDKPNEDDEVNDGDDGEKEFEPTVDMLMNEFDDEKTMEEEEALDDQENEAEELDALTKEQDIPLEELLKLYGYNQAEKETEKEEVDDEIEEETIEEKKDESEEIVEESNLSQSKNDGLSENSENELSNKGEKRGSMSPPPAKKSRSELARFYEAAVEGRSLRSSAGAQEDEDDESGDDETEEGKDYSWKKTIMIGPSYQATVPTGMCSYDDTPPYENEDKQLWDPDRLAAHVTEEYLAKSAETLGANGSIGVSGIPTGSHIRDDEQALYLLLQCGYNTEEALRRKRMNAVPPADTMSLWSEEECRAFETGLRVYGKDFHSIRQQKVGTRSVGELVQFYYLWKKTERHDVFANSFRIEKKKYTLHPGTTDYMERFIDEQDVGRDRSASPNYHSLIYGDIRRKQEAGKLDTVTNGEKSEGDIPELAQVSAGDNGPSIMNS